MGRELVLITYRKSYMSFRLVSKSVTLNDLERHNGRFCVISATSVAFSAHCVKCLKIYLNFLQQKYSPKLLVFSDILLMAIFSVHHPQRRR